MIKKVLGSLSWRFNHLIEKIKCELISYHRINLSKINSEIKGKNERYYSLIKLLKRTPNLPKTTNWFYTGDLIPISPYIWSYSTKNEKYIRLIPDFVFTEENNRQGHNYSTQVNIIKTYGSVKAKTKKIGWAGNLFSHKNRLVLYNKSLENPDLLNITHFCKHKIPEKYSFTNTYVDLKELIKTNKYLIDIEGYGYSSRLKLLLFSNRVMFIQDRPYKEYFYQWMEPYIHYIPVIRDLSNLIDQYNWAENHPKEVETIRINARNFSDKFLSFDFAVGHLSTQLNS